MVDHPSKGVSILESFEVNQNFHEIDILKSEDILGLLGHAAELLTVVIHSFCKVNKVSVTKCSKSISSYPCGLSLGLWPWRFISSYLHFMAAVRFWQTLLAVPFSQLRNGRYQEVSDLMKKDMKTVLEV